MTPIFSEGGRPRAGPGLAHAASKGLFRRVMHLCRACVVVWMDGWMAAHQMPRQPRPIDRQLLQFPFYYVAEADIRRGHPQLERSNHVVVK